MPDEALTGEIVPETPPRKPITRRIYETVEPYIPQTSGAGKGAMYAAIGLGVAGAVGLIGYGAYQAISSTTNQCTASSPCGQQMSTCDNELTNISTQITSLTNQFIAEDISKNVAYPTTAQQTTLNNLYQQQNTIIQNCIGSVTKNYNLDFVSWGITDLFYAGTVAIIAIAGAKAYSYIKGRGYWKPPKGGNGFINPATFWQAYQMGYTDFLKSSGKAPASWDSNGKQSATNIADNASTQSGLFTTSLVNVELIDAATASAILASVAAIAAEDTALLVAVLV